MLVVFSIAPFVLFLILLLWKKTSLLTASVATLALVLGLSFFFWKILPSLLVISFAKGFLVAFDIFIIIFGAIFFLEILKEVGVIGNIGYFLESFSKDYRVQVILLAWFLENFLEGTGGFGTPGMVVAPLLVSLGLPPIKAVIIALLGNSTAGIFGAAGTPIRVGFAGLSTAMVPPYSALVNCIGFLVPVFMLWTLVSGQKDKKTQFLEALPFALWAGVAFVIPSLLTVFLGQEFSSILGSFIGVLLIFLTTKFKIFLPKTERTLKGAGEPRAALPLYKVMLPYAALIVLLVAGKLLIGSAGIKIAFANHVISFFNPGIVFLIVGLPIAIFWGKRRGLTLNSFKVAFTRAIEPSFVIAFMATIVQLMINSGNNFSGLPSSLEFIARGFENKSLPFLAPIMGALGSFLTGSVTVSNIMFGNFMQTASKVIGFNGGIILSLELVGAAAGNMIALADILAAEAVVGLHDQERQVLKGVIIPCAIYVLLTGLLGMLFF